MFHYWSPSSAGGSTTGVSYVISSSSVWMASPVPLISTPRISQTELDFSSARNWNAMTIFFPEYSATTSSILTLDEMGESKYKNAGWTFDYATTNVPVGNNDTSTTTTAGINSNVLIFTAPTEAGGTVATLPTVILTYSEALAIDKKMDNGAHSSGSVYGGLGTCNTTETGDACALYIKIDL